LVSLYLKHLESRSFSPSTIRRRQVSLLRFAKFIAPMPLELVDGDHIEEWMSTLHAARTRHAYRSDLSAFYAWTVKRKILAHNPVDDTDPIRVPRGLPRPLPLQAIRHVLSAARAPELRIALALAIFAGLRRAEICRLTTDDVHLHTTPPELFVRRSKWGKDRRVPLHPELAEMLGHRRQGRVVSYTPDALGRTAAAHIRACGYNYTLHSLRSTFATELSRATSGNLLLVAELLGHENLNTTRGYVGLAGIQGVDAVGGMYGGDAA